MYTYSVERSLLNRAGVDELLLLKRSYDDGSYFYAIAHLVNPEAREYAAIPASQKRVAEIQAGLVTLREAFEHPDTAFWYRCTKQGEAFSSAESESGNMPAELMPDNITLAEAIAASAAPRKVKAPRGGLVVPRAKKIENAVLAVLSQAECEGPYLRLTGQLDRKLYQAVNKVIDAAGGKWKGGKTKAHVFDGDATEIIEPILLTGEIARKEDFGFFPTPRSLVRSHVLPRLSLTASSHVLEPSAGVGGIAAELAKICRVDCIELQEKNVKVLQEAGLYARVLQADFLALDPADFPRYDAVVMNPPFAKQADIKHVLHAAKFVKEGGQIVAIMAAGITFRKDRLTQQLNDFVVAQGGEVEELPESSFKESGTQVNTAIVSMTISAPELELAVGSGFTR